MTVQCTNNRLHRIETVNLNRHAGNSTLSVAFRPTPLLGPVRPAASHWEKPRDSTTNLAPLTKLARCIRGSQALP